MLVEVSGAWCRVFFICLKSRVLWGRCCDTCMVFSHTGGLPRMRELEKKKTGLLCLLVVWSVESWSWVGCCRAGHRGTGLGRGSLMKHVELKKVFCELGSRDTLVDWPVARPHIGGFAQDWEAMDVFADGPIIMNIHYYYSTAHEPTGPTRVAYSARGRMRKYVDPYLFSMEITLHEVMT